MNGNALATECAGTPRGQTLAPPSTQAQVYATLELLCVPAIPLCVQLFAMCQSQPAEEHANAALCQPGVREFCMIG